VFDAVQSPFLVPFDNSFRLGARSHSPPTDAPARDDRKKRLEKAVEELAELQPVLFADDRYAVLIVFQAMDAAGKDGTIRALLQGVNPAGCQVFGFKAPSAEELDHDFLWRTVVRLPERGRIGVFNRSYYEEVLIVRVHPALLAAQRLPDPASDRLFEERFESIRHHEQHLARNGTVIIKFFLNVSKQEQKERFLSRLDEPEKNWKFHSGDVTERGLWDSYMHAYEQALGATSRPWAPWYAIPADDKPFMRMAVAEIVVASLQRLGLRYPVVTDAERARLDEMRKLLEREGG
jgi:PPK2 family polyphosphate:nucleotide phosphotransferase